MNPCPCGRAGTGECRCSEAGLARYRRRISGPLLDRFDLRVVVHPVASDQLVGSASGESTDVVAERVRGARERARRRSVRSNRDLTGSQLEVAAPLDTEASAILTRAIDDGRLSGRGLRRVRSVALTISDLAGTEGPIGADAVAQALALRAELSIGAVLVGQR